MKTILEWDHFLVYDLALSDHALEAILAAGIVSLATVAWYAIIAIWEGWDD